MRVKKGNQCNFWTAIEDEHGTNAERVVNARCICGYVKRFYVKNFGVSWSPLCCRSCFLDCRKSKTQRKPPVRMSNVRRDLSGSRFGKLLVVRRVMKPSRFIKWLCVCDCGTCLEVYGHNMTTGKTRSCGCAKGFLLQSSGVYDKDREEQWESIRVGRTLLKEMAEATR